jgi:phosphate/phosphite/phosphonate ABC transporter binding protein
LVLLLSPLVLTGSAIAAGTRRAVRIGVLAKRGPERCLEKWIPTAEYLSEKIADHTFKVVPLDYDEVAPAVRDGEIDFVLANPSIYVEIEAHYGASRIATLKNHRQEGDRVSYGGLIFRRTDRNDIKSLADLKGKVFMAVNEKSFGGWQMAWRELKEHGIDPYRDFKLLRFGGTHDAVVHAVRDGQADAGTVRTDTLERMAAEGKIRIDDFHVMHGYGHAEQGSPPPFIHSTRSYPEWPFAKAQHTSQELAEKVTCALLEMPPDSPAARAARCAGWTVPLNYQPVHECLKELRIDPYKDFGKITLANVFRNYWPWFLATALAVIVLTAGVVFIARLNRRLAHTQSQLQNELAERERAEETLRETRNYLENLLDFANAPIIVWDPAFKITRFNHAFEQMTDYSAEEITGLELQVLFPEDTRDESLEKIRRTSSGEYWESAEIPILQKNGDVRIALWNSANICANDGKTLVTTIAQGQDITERVRAKEALQEMNRELSKKNARLERMNTDLSEYACVISHDVRAPLRAVHNYTDFLLEDLSTTLSGDQKKYLDGLAKAVCEAEALVTDLLELVRLDSQTSESDEVDLGEFLRELTVSMNLSREADIQMADDWSVIKASPMLLKMVFQNLIENGLKFNHSPHKVIQLGWRCGNGDGYELFVRDNGIGIEPQYLHKIFGIFQRCPTNSKVEGTGIGLAIVSKAVNRLSGLVRVESELGEGSTFFVTLPIKQGGERHEQ